MNRSLLVPLALATLLAACESVHEGGEPTTEPYRWGTRSASSSSAAAKPASNSGADAGSTAAVGTEYTQSSQAFPTGDDATSALRLEKVVPSEVVAGQEFDVLLRVTNLTGLPLEDVRVREVYSAGFELVSSEPAAMREDGGTASWSLGTLPAKANREIAVKARAKAEGSLTSCAEVDYRSALCTAIPVVKPGLALDFATLAEAQACEEIPIELSVTNSGTGVARDITIDAALPAGLTTADGRAAIQLKVAALEAGATKTFTVDARAAGPGTYVTTAQAAMAGGVKAGPIQREIVVRQPRLEATLQAPSGLVIGRDGAWEFTVRNTGDGIARDASLEATLPKSLTVISSDPKAVVSGRTLRWDLGDLAADATRTVTARLRSQEAGDGHVEAVAQAYCADPATCASDTGMKGIAAILMEVIDLEDPVLVGEEVVYEIHVTNQGFAPDYEIALVCTLDEGMSLVHGGGASEAHAEGNVITFAPVPVIDAKEEATWTLRIKAETPGDKRFKVSMTSRERERPVEETEATTFYQ